VTQVGGSARHTFGSDPDAAGRVAIDRGRIPRTEGDPAPLELPPRPVWWLAAQERAGELIEGEQRRIVVRLLSHVEEGWTLATELAAVCDHPEQTPQGEVVHRLLAFLRNEVVDLFTSLALASSLAVPALGGAHPDPDPDQIDSVAERFARNVQMVHLAASDPVIPPALRDTLRRVCRDLLDWCPEFSVLALAAARLVAQRD
jgi:hypothetical protein